MSALPEKLERHLVETALGERRFAFIEVDKDGQAVAVGGALDAFGLGSIRPGQAVRTRFEFLHEHLLHGPGETEVLPRIELTPGRSTDIHFVRDAVSTTLLFLDVTDEAQRERHYQQKGNELSLALRAWGVAVFERLDSGRFRILGLVPSWLRAMGFSQRDERDPIGRFPFLESFVDGALATWEGRAAPIQWSEVWVEEDARGKEWFLEANATTLGDGRRLLVIQSAERRSHEQQHILQEARSRSLDLQRLRSEVDKKEVLLHCIIHDLKGPLAGMIGSMSLIRKPELAADRKQELLGLGLEQARHQEAMIRGLLDAFVADVEALEQFETEVDSAPDLLVAIDRAMRTYANAFEQQGIGLVLALETGLSDHCEICGDAARLERVLGNLLENALRHSPPSGVVRIGVADLGDRLGVNIYDQGAGVSEEMRKSLFKKFARGRERTGTGGLGLYFCRSTVEKWGGVIGYEPIEGGGSRFWLELRKATRS